MARDLSSGMASEITADQLRPVYLVRLEFPIETVRLNTSLYSLTYNSESYTGAGSLLRVGEIEESTDLKAVGVSLGLSGIDSSIYSNVSGTAYQGSETSIYLGLLQSDLSTFYGEPHEVFRGQMDVMTVSSDGETLDINLDVENIFADFERAVPSYYTPQYQKELFPDDTFCDYVASLQDKRVLWGVPR